MDSRVTSNECRDWPDNANQRRHPEAIPTVLVLETEKGLVRIGVRTKDPEDDEKSNESQAVRADGDALGQSQLFQNGNAEKDGCNGRSNCH